MRVSDYIARALEQYGVPHVFEMSGGMITYLLDSLHREGKVRVVSTHHEQAAAFAAEASGRITGVPGVAMATSGPGATNLVTGIGSCYFDSSPAVFITGQVNRNELKGDLPVRQLGFQETDIVSVARPLTKAAWQATAPEDVPELLRRAFALAASGRPGPVLLDIPMDVQRSQILDATTIPTPEPEAGPSIDRAALEELAAALSASQRPLILAGGGIWQARAAGPFRDLARRLGVPVVNSLMGVDALPYSDPLRVGMIGTYGNRWANLALGRSDFLLVLGSRLDIRQTGADVGAFKGDRTIYQVDCDRGEMNNRVTSCRTIEAHLLDFVQALHGMVEEWPFVHRETWLSEIEALRREWPDTAELDGTPGINPNMLMHQLSEVAAGAGSFVVDVGQHQMWAAQSLEANAGQRFLTTGGMGSMGFALPAGVGAALAQPGKPVVAIAGDGGFQTNIQELQTVARNRLPLKMVVVNNGCHGMVRQFQQSYFEERYQSTYWGYSAPDFSRVAKAYDIESHTVEELGEVQEALARLWKDPASPFLLQVKVDTFANAYPKIAFGRPMTDMEPMARPVQMETK